MCKASGEARACACRGEFSLEHGDTDGAVDYLDRACAGQHQPSCVAARAVHAEQAGRLAGRELVAAYHDACDAGVESACTRARVLTQRARANRVRWRVALVAVVLVGGLLALGLGRVLVHRRRARARRQVA